MRERLQPSEMLMFLTAGLTFTVVARGWTAFCAILCLAALASWKIRRRLSLSTKGHYIVQGVMALPFFIMGGRYAWRGDHPVELAMRVAVLGGVYVFCRALFELYREPQEARAEVFHFGTVTLMTVGGISLENPYYPICVAVYAASVIAYLRNPYAEKTAPCSPGLLVTILFAVALTVAYQLFDYMPHFRQLARETYTDALSGEGQLEDRLFGPGSNLWSVDNLSNSQEMVARVFGPPSYLRGRVRCYYREGRWQARVANNGELEDLPGAHVFQLPGETQPQAKKWRIQPIYAVNGPLPIPPGTSRLETTEERCRIGAFDELICKTDQSYSVLATDQLGQGRSPKRPLPQSWIWNTYLERPPFLLPVLQDTVDKIVGEEDDPQKMAEAIVAYFHKNGRLGVFEKEIREMPISYFLSKDMTGNSAFFSTAMALLLRQRGVPTRFAVGYKMVEKNMWGGYYVVRNRDAHAWVEVYLGEQGWVRFDPTPKVPLTESHPGGPNNWSMEAFLDNLSVQIDRFGKWLGSRDWQKTGLLTLGIILALGALALALRQRIAANKLKDLDPTVLKLQQLYQRATKALAKHNIEKRRWQTALELSEEAKDHPTMASWLLEYSRVRFRGASEPEITALEKSLDQAIRSLQK